MSEQTLIGLFFMEVLIINIGQMLMLRRYNLSGQILKLPYISERREKLFALLLHWSTIYKDTGYWRRAAGNNQLITHSEGNQPGEHILDRSNLSRYILFIPAAGSGAHVNLVFRPEQETAGRAFRACIFAVIGWLAGYSIRSRLLVNESSADASLRCRGQFRSRRILDLTHLFDQAQ